MLRGLIQRMRTPSSITRAAERAANEEDPPPPSQPPPKLVHQPAPSPTPRQRDCQTDVMPMFDVSSLARTPEEWERLPAHLRAATPRPAPFAEEEARIDALLATTFGAPAPAPEPDPSMRVTGRFLRVDEDTRPSMELPIAPPPSELDFPHLSESASRSVTRHHPSDTLGAFDALAARLRARVERSEMDWEIVEGHLRQAMTAERRHPIRMQQSSYLTRNLSAPIRPIDEQLEMLLRVGAYRHLEGVELPDFPGERRLDFPEGLLLLPRIVDHPLVNRTVSNDDMDAYTAALNQALSLVQSVLPRFRNQLRTLAREGELPQRSTVYQLDHATVLSVLGSWGSFGPIKLLPVQLGRRHIGASPNKTRKFDLLPQEHGMDLYAAAVYLLSHADLLSDLNLERLPCSFTCDGMRLRSSSEDGFSLVPLLEFLPSGEILLSATEPDSFAPARGSATVYDPKRENLIALFS